MEIVWRIMRQHYFSIYFMGALALFAALAYFFGILAEIDHSAAFVFLFFACLYFMIGWIARTRFSLVIVIVYAVVIAIQMGYFIYLKQRFTPAPILWGAVMIYDAIHDYKGFRKKKEKTQSVGDL
jgi:4-hydroxybenzoate polyprenyltransferase